MGLRDTRRKVHRKLRRTIRKRHEAKPGGDRRHKLGRIVRFLKDRLARVVRKIRRKKRPLGPGSGEGPWAGSQSVGEKIVVAVAAEFGAYITSRKRSATDPLSLANPGSDHNAANTTAYAWDIGTYNGSPIAHAVAHHLGIEGYTTGNYTAYWVRAQNGRLYRVQILWAVSGHFNHVHVGIHLA